MEEQECDRDDRHEGESVSVNDGHEGESVCRWHDLLMKSVRDDRHEGESVSVNDGMIC